MVKCIALIIPATFLLLALSHASPISSRQLLPARPGYVPVYIRNGDTPLEEINLELAEAFHAIPSGRSAGRSNTKAVRADDEEEKPKLKSQPQPAPVKEVIRDEKPAPKKKEEPIVAKAKEEIKKVEDPKVKNVKKEQEKIAKLEEKKVVPLDKKPEAVKEQPKEEKH